MATKKKLQRLFVVLLVGVMCVFGVRYVSANMQSVRADETNMIMIHEGASVRLVEGSSGIRFKGEINKAYVEQLENTYGKSNVRYGIVIVPKFYLNNVSNFTFEAFAARYASTPCLKIQAKNIIEHEETYEFRCALTGLSDNIFGWKFAARSYIEIVHEDKTVEYRYSDFDKNTNVRSVRSVAEAALADSSQNYTDVEKSILNQYAKKVETVYISNSGDDKNSGTDSQHPYATLSQAIDSVTDGGTIVVCGSYSIASGFNWEEDANKTVTIIGDSVNAILDFRKVAGNIIIGNNVKFDNVKLEFGDNKNVFANGHKLEIRMGVTLENPINLYGGGYQADVVETDITVMNGNYYRIYGGGSEGKVTENTKVYIGGNTNSKANPASHDATYNIYGGGFNGDVAGNTYVTFEGAAKANYIFGGSAGTGKVGGTNVTFAGGKTMSLYGGNYASNGISSVNLQVTGGEIEQLFGANQCTSMTGNVVLELTGGKITRRVYGGCYNEYTSSEQWKSKNFVTGTVELKISSGAVISLDAKQSDGEQYDDRSIYVCSRYGTKQNNETCILTFLDESAYSKYSSMLGAQDWKMSIIMMSVSNYYTIKKNYS